MEGWKKWFTMPVGESLLDRLSLMSRSYHGSRILPSSYRNRSYDPKRWKPSGEWVAGDAESCSAMA